MRNSSPTENVGKSLSNEEEDEELQPLTVQKHLLFNLLFYSSNKNGTGKLVIQNYQRESSFKQPSLA